MGLHSVVEPHHTSHHLGLVPQLDVVLPVLPQLRRRRDSKHHVAELRLCFSRFEEGGSGIGDGGRGRGREVVDGEGAVAAGA